MATTSVQTVDVQAIVNAVMQGVGDILPSMVAAAIGNGTESPEESTNSLVNPNAPSTVPATFTEPRETPKDNLRYPTAKDASAAFQALVGPKDNPIFSGHDRAVRFAGILIDGLTERGLVEGEHFTVNADRTKVNSGYLQRLLGRTEEKDLRKALVGYGVLDKLAVVKSSSAPAPKPAPAAKRTYDASKVREWAKLAGRDVKPSGRLPKAILDAYFQAHGK